jgi:fused signal recognition particle receptor
MAGLFKKILQRLSRDHVDWDELEESLILADIGLPMTTLIIERMRELGRSLKPEDAVNICREEILKIIPAPPLDLSPLPGSTKVILIVGVNGTGKTTSAAKLACHLKQSNYSVMLAAADTFRAAAVEQLQVWAERVDVPLISGSRNADPSSVCFEAQSAALDAGCDFLICDTAGRIHTRHNLMEELKKIRRTLGKRDAGAPHEIFLVVDATTGSNALAQARQFNEATELSGLIVTKLDGSGKGGVVVSIAHEMAIPTRFIGVGEKMEDLKAFCAEHFVQHIL